MSSPSTAIWTTAPAACCATSPSFGPAEDPADLTLDLARLGVLGCTATATIADIHHAAVTVGTAATLANAPAFAKLVLSMSASTGSSP